MEGHAASYAACNGGYLGAVGPFWISVAAIFGNVLAINSTDERQVPISGCHTVLDSKFCPIILACNILVLYSFESKLK